MTLSAKVMRHLPGIWVVAAIGAGILGAVVTRLAAPVVAWDWAAAGWLLAVINSALVVFINGRAIGRSRGAFIVWGLLVHALRVLTLLGIFAFIIFHEDSRKASFFILMFAGLFSMMAVEILDLFKIQGRIVK